MPPHTQIVFTPNPLRLRASAGITSGLMLCGGSFLNGVYGADIVTSSGIYGRAVRIERDTTKEKEGKQSKAKVIRETFKNRYLYIQNTCLIQSLYAPRMIKHLSTSAGVRFGIMSKKMREREKLHTETGRKDARQSEDAGQQQGDPHGAMIE